MDSSIYSLSVKRPFEVEPADDGAGFSAAPPEKIQRRSTTCQHCSKPFDRACDYRKHQKIHTRPFKCSKQGCPYLHKGFSTAAERDRHANDKHAASPDLHRCPIQGCRHGSRRMSNLKQHMEKEHGCPYIRTRGKRRSPSQPLEMLSTGNLTFGSFTPETPEIATPVVSHNGPGPACAVNLSTPAVDIFSTLPEISTEGLDWYSELGNLDTQNEDIAEAQQLADLAVTDEEPAPVTSSWEQLGSVMLDLSEARGEVDDLEASIDLLYLRQFDSVSTILT